MKLKRKLFARRDYEGLDDLGKQELRAERNELAKKLRIERKKINIIDDASKELFPKLRNKYSNLRNSQYTNRMNDANLIAKKAYEKAKEGSDYRNAEILERRNQNIKKIRRNRRLKKAGKVGLATLGTVGLIYGGKKVYDHYNSKDN